jgi:hypothetical protein
MADMVRRDIPGSSAALRRELAWRNGQLAGNSLHETTIGSVPATLYREDEHGRHGNFLPASYRRICANPDWQRRLRKSYSASRSIVRGWENEHRELDCSNSSDALLMNVFCYPGVLRRLAVCLLLGIEPGLSPEYGFRPELPILETLPDRTELDMRLGSLFVEAKLTESGSSSAPMRLLKRYRDFEEVFDNSLLASQTGRCRDYQLIRGALAAHIHNGSYLLLCDDRGTDWRARWFQVMNAVRYASLRTRLKLLTWQELSSALPPVLQRFLAEKYGICPY